jgi:hypothetical protein
MVTGYRLPVFRLQVSGCTLQGENQFMAGSLKSETLNLFREPAPVFRPLYPVTCNL